MKLLLEIVSSLIFNISDWSNKTNLKLVRCVTYRNANCRFQNERREHFHHFPFIWKEAAKVNYSTAFPGDNAKLSLFNYLADGFKSEYTDFYTNRPAPIRSLKRQNWLGQAPQ